MAVPVDGRKRFRGTIAAVKDEQVTLRSDDAPSDVSLTMDEMSDARLVLTDALVTQALRREKAAKREAKAAKREARHSRQQARKANRSPNESNEGE
jgi:ribosome maturation factor RimP